MSYWKNFSTLEYSILYFFFVTQDILCSPCTLFFDKLHELIVTRLLVVLYIVYFSIVLLQTH